ncbi:MAG: glycosyltransferase family 39 protein [Pseudomonadota bacterium]
MSGTADRLGGSFGALLDWAAMRPWRGALLVLVVACAVILPGQAQMPVTDRDEGRFVQASKQMMETGDLIDIRLQDQPRWKKPVGIYWLQAASASVQGGVEAHISAYRLPSALAAVLVALLTMWGARPMIGARGATLAGIMMVSTLLMVVEGHIAKTDAALAATAAMVLGALSHLLLGQGGRWTAAVFWLGIALGILLKGPIVPVIALLAIAWVWIVARRRPDFSRFHTLPGLAGVVLLVAPWLVAIWIISDGAFFAESLGRDMGAKLTSGQEKHWGPPGLYLGIIWGTFWPWAALIPLAAGWIWSQRKEPWAGLLAGWVIPFWLILEAVPTKLPHYVLPLYPALVIALAAWAVSKNRQNAPRWCARTAAALAALPPIGLALAVMILPAVLEEMVIYDALPLVAIAIVAGWYAAKAALAQRPFAQIAASVIAAMAIYPAVLGLGLPSLNTAFASPRIAAVIEQYQTCASGPAFSVGYHEPSLVFETYTEIKLADPNGAMAGLREDPGAMVMIEDRWRKILGDKLPDGLVTRARVEYFNYNRGKRQGADLVTQADPRWDKCSGEGKE